jgi:transcriptional regulator with XRE-family HTH domain
VNTMTSLGIAIREERESRNLTRRQLAEMTDGSVHAIRNYERRHVKPDIVWLSRFEKRLKTQNPVILEYLKRPHLQTATKAELEYLYSQMPICEMAILYDTHWHTVRKRLRELGIKKREMRRDFRAKWWEVREGEDIYPILNLKQFAIAHDLNYPHICYRITYYGEYQDERFTIRHYTPNRDTEPSNTITGADEDWGNIC